MGSRSKALSVLVALAIAGATFGIATAVQAAIPSADVVTIPAGGTYFMFTICPSGQAVSGGVNIPNWDGDIEIHASYPDAGLATWAVILTSVNGGHLYADDEAPRSARRSDARDPSLYPRGLERASRRSRA